MKFFVAVKQCYTYCNLERMYITRRHLEQRASN